MNVLQWGKGLLGRWARAGRPYGTGLIKWCALGVAMGLLGGAVGSAFHHCVDEATALRTAHPWLLAGGMSPANFRQALTACRPDGVDCNSGVEDAPGQKDARAMTDMARLVEEVFRDAPADPSRRA